jgi:hypothetical protein
MWHELQPFARVRVSAPTLMSHGRTHAKEKATASWRSPFAIRDGVIAHSTNKSTAVGFCVDYHVCQSGILPLHEASQFLSTSRIFVIPGVSPNTFLETCVVLPRMGQ